MSVGKLHDNRGLLLIKRGETGKWVYRYSFRGKRRDTGLGSWPVVTISEARKTRDKWSAVLASGKDPITTRAAVIETERLADEYARAEAEDKNDPTFAELVELVFEAKKATLRGDGTRGRWKSPLELYILPAFGKNPRIADQPAGCRHCASVASS